MLIYKVKWFRRLSNGPRQKVYLYCLEILTLYKLFSAKKILLQEELPVHIL